MPPLGEPSAALRARVAKEAVQAAAIQYMTKIFGIGEAAANRIAAAVDTAVGWLAFVDRTFGAAQDGKH
jgi:hypothetical protein